MSKISSKYKTIGQISEELGLVDAKTGKPKTHVIRFWESKFDIFKSKKVINSRRYYDNNDIEIFKRIKFLLKEKGMTILGANKVLKSDDYVDYKKMNTINSIRVNKIKYLIKDIKKLL